MEIYVFLKGQAFEINRASEDKKFSRCEMRSSFRNSLQCPNLATLTINGKMICGKCLAKKFKNLVFRQDHFNDNSIPI